MHWEEECQSASTRHKPTAPKCPRPVFHPHSVMRCNNAFALARRAGWGVMHVFSRHKRLPNFWGNMSFSRGVEEGVGTALYPQGAQRLRVQTRSLYTWGECRRQNQKRNACSDLTHASNSSAGVAETFNRIQAERVSAEMSENSIHQAISPASMWFTFSGWPVVPMDRLQRKQ